MPKGDFRAKGDVLDPLSAVKVLAVMCHPSDARSREIMLRRIPDRIVIPRHQKRPDNTGNGWLHDFWVEFLGHCRQGCMAGALTLALAHVAARKHRGDPALVLPLAVRIADQFARVPGLDASAESDGIAALLSEAEVYGAFQSYRSVSHLWATFVYNKLKLGQDIAPLSAQDLPTFLACAEEIAVQATSVEGGDGDVGLELVTGDLWTFVLPAALRKTASMELIEPAAAPNVARTQAEAKASLVDSH